MWIKEEIKGVIRKLFLIRRIDKPNIVYPYNEILSIKNELSIHGTA